jgi:UDP-GlcNAc:undecaprenyl-phosphate/decaprenyl-phosphate GlcNAc-1-phosphate transferase
MTLSIFYFPVVFISALLLALILLPITINLLIKFDVMDHPNHRKIHTQPIPRMAGVAIYIAFAFPLIFFFSQDGLPEAWKGILYGSGIALLIGGIDDVWNVPAVIKLISLFLLTLFIWHFGVITNLPICQILGFDFPSLNIAFNLIITMLWLVGVCSAINALDHMDGLAGGVSIIAAFAYFAVSIQSGQADWAIISLALMGSLLGFLCYNKHPAKVFMGDSGSFFLGFTLASLGIMGGWSANPLKAAIIPIAVLSVPIFDLCYVIIARRLNGTTHTILESIAYCGKDHIGHRLNKLGFSQTLAVAMVYLIAFAIAISALTIRQANYLESILLLIQIIMIYITMAIFMEVSLKNRKPQSD